MADIRFNEDPQDVPQATQRSKSYLTRLVLSTGIVTTDKAAQTVLLVIAVAALLLAFLAPELLGGRLLSAPEKGVPRVLTAPGIYSPVVAP